MYLCGKASDYGAMGCLVDPSRWTHRVISRCSHCYITKAVVCAIASLVVYFVLTIISKLAILFKNKNLIHCRGLISD